MISRTTRRAVLHSTITASLLFGARSSRAQSAAPAFSYPIRRAEGELPGDGLIIRHGYATENTWYNPGWLHTGEDWYLADSGETGGAEVVAIADGTVVYAGADYPGLVVIIEHETSLYSMYGHLDYDGEVAVGQEVARGERIGTVLTQLGGRAPSHLHFEVRTFLTTPEVNGNAPRYGYGCGFDCPPGPGYWPIDAPDHPSDMGWRNPTHVIGRRMFPDGEAPAGVEVAISSTAPERIPLWSSPTDFGDAEGIGELLGTPVDRFPLLAIVAGHKNPDATSAEHYELWYRIAVPGAALPRPWVRAAVPDTTDTGSDGRPSSVRFALLPTVEPA